MLTTSSYQWMTRMLTVKSWLSLSGNPFKSDVSWFTSDSSTRTGSEHFDGPFPDADDLAFLQFTSGSTSSPKGVCITFNNLQTNYRNIERYAMHTTPESEILSFLPPQHDMGYVLFVLVHTG